MPHVLVLTLHAGEPQLDRCVASIEAQVGVDVVHEVISGLANVDAHRLLYETVERRATDFDLSIKIDADMVLRGEGVLAEIARLFAADPELDHAQFAVHDFYTDRSIMGVHAFSPRVRWATSDERLFVDPAPVIPGRRLLQWSAPAPVADHSPDPSMLQAFRFGIHRGLKAFQPGRKRVRGSQAREQWHVLVDTWDAFVRSGDLRRGLAVYGADLVWQGLLSMEAGGYYAADQEALLAGIPRDPAKLQSQLGPRWRPGPRRTARRLWSLGPTGVARLTAAAARQQVTSAARVARRRG